MRCEPDQTVPSRAPNDGRHGTEDEEAPVTARPDDAPRDDRGRRRTRRLTQVACGAVVVLGLGLVGAGLAAGDERPVEPPLTSAADAGDAVAAPPAPSPSPSPSPEPSGPRPAATPDPGQLLPPAEEGESLLPPPPEPVETEEPVVEVADPVRLRVPAIDVDTELLHLGLDEEGALAVPPRDGPDNLKASWYDGSPAPGEVGPSIFAGHIDSKAGPSVFYLLSEVEEGDEVLVDRADGTTATFVVDGLERYAKDDFPTARVYGRVDDAQIRLITCGGEFDRSTGHYRDNTVVYGHLVEG